MAETETILRWLLTNQAEEYKSELSFIIKTIIKDNCDFNITTDETYAFYTRFEDGKGKITLNPNKYNPSINMIWAILHEYGHHHQEDKKTNITSEEELNREEDAWTRAETMLNNFPNLLKQKESFHAYKNDSLNSYRNRN